MIAYLLLAQLFWDHCSLPLQMERLFFSDNRVIVANKLFNEANFFITQQIYDFKLFLQLFQRRIILLIGIDNSYSTRCYKKFLLKFDFQKKIGWKTLLYLRGKETL